MRLPADMAAPKAGCLAPALGKLQLLLTTGAPGLPGMTWEPLRWNCRPRWAFTEQSPRRDFLRKLWAQASVPPLPPKGQPGPFLPADSRELFAQPVDLRSIQRRRLDECWRRRQRSSKKKGPRFEREPRRIGPTRRWSIEVGRCGLSLLGLRGAYFTDLG